MGNATSLKHFNNNNMHTEAKISDYSGFNKQDEISLFDLFVVINRRKWIVAVVFVLGVVSAAVYSAMQKDTYTYTTTIELGVMDAGEGLREIDSPNNLIAKIKQAYIPSLGSQVTATGLNVSSPKKSNLITVSNTSTRQGKIALYADQHQKLLELIREDQQKRLAELGISQYTKTRILTPTREHKVVRKSQSLLWMSILGAFLGLVLGITLTFVAEFVANIRNELRRV